MMTDFLDAFLDRALLEKELDLTQVPGYHARSLALRKYYDEIHHTLGLDFTDRLTSLEAEQRYQENLACFRYGFRLAGQFFREIFL